MPYRVHIYHPAQLFRTFSITIESKFFIDFVNNSNFFESILQTFLLGVSVVVEIVVVTAITPPLVGMVTEVVGSKVCLV